MRLFKPERDADGDPEGEMLDVALEVAVSVLALREPDGDDEGVGAPEDEAVAEEVREDVDVVEHVATLFVEPAGHNKGQPHAGQDWLPSKN